MSYDDLNGGSEATDLYIYVKITMKIGFCACFFFLTTRAQNT